MAMQRGNLNLFGIDLAALGMHWRQGWDEAMRWPVFARLFPALDVCRLGPDGQVLPTRPGSVTADASRADYLAALLPEDLVLRRSLALPMLSPHAQRQAIELELTAASPFPLDQLVWGWVEHTSSSGRIVELALASRSHVDAHLATLAPLLGERLPEVWVAGSPPIVLRGFGESRRFVRQSRQKKWVAGLLALALFLSLILIATPALQKRARVIDALARSATLYRESAAVVAQRDELGRINQQLDLIVAHAAERPDLLPVLARLTTLLPDTAYLTRLELRGDGVRLGGLADNAAAVLETLGAQPDFQNLRTPAAITRDRVSGRETFSAEFNLADVEDGVAGAAEEGGQ